MSDQRDYYHRVRMISFKTGPLSEHIAIMLLYEIFHVERHTLYEKLKLIMYKTFTGEVIVSTPMSCNKESYSDCKPIQQ